MKIREEELLDYMDGTLVASRRADVEAHLAQDAEMAALFADMPHAMDALRDWNEGETEAASTRDLWPQIREQLPPRAGSALGRMLPRPARKTAATSTRASAERESQPSWMSAFLPTQSPWKMSARFAAVALIVALGALFLSPRDATVQVQAEQLTPAEQTFIQQSVQRHAAYETVRSVNGATVGGTTPSGDGRSSDGDGETDTTDNPYSP